MQAKLEKIENSEAYIQIEVDPAKMEEGFDYAYRRIVKQVNIPGFRKGRAPRQLVENFYGKEILYQDALEYVVPEVYEEAIKTLNIEPIAQPEFDLGEIEEDKPFTFTAIVAVKPEIKLGQLEGLEISIPKYEITEEDVEKRVEQIRSNYAQLEKKENEPAELGDTVIIDFEGFVDGVAFEGGKGEDYPLELGSRTFISGFEEKLVGTKAGDEVEIDVTFPEQYHEPSLAGKPAVFKVKVKEIETKKLRPLDDEFVQEVSEFETVEEFKEDVRKTLVELMERQKKDHLKQLVVEKALEVSEVPAPRAVVRMQAEGMVQDFAQRIAMQGITLEQYFNATQSTMEDLINDIWPDAERNVKISFLMEKIIEEKGFEITDEEVDKEIEKMASSMGLEFDEAKNRLAGVLDNIKYGMKVDKALDYLIDNANITEVAPETKSEENIVESDE